MERDYSRKKKSNTKSSPSGSAIVILLLLLNTLALGTLVVFAFYSFDQASNQDQRLKTMENKIALLDNSLKKTSNVALGNSEKNNLPMTNGSNTTNSSTNETNQVSVDEQNTQESNKSEGNSPTSNKTYIVQSGDTLSSIAEKHSLSVDELMSKNNITDSILLVGQSLTIN